MFRIAAWQAPSLSIVIFFLVTLSKGKGHPGSTLVGRCKRRLSARTARSVDEISSRKYDDRAVKRELLTRRQTPARRGASVGSEGRDTRSPDNNNIRASGVSSPQRRS